MKQPCYQTRGFLPSLSFSGADNALYKRTWNDMALSPSRTDDIKKQTPAHKEYQWARGNLVGQFPPKDDRWRRLQNYYLNCIADCDCHIDRILQELDDLNLTQDTIVIMTSDHGELLGAHQIHGKGAAAYREQLIAVFINIDYNYRK